MSASSLAAKLNMASKAALQAQQPAAYRDHPEYAETASMASAVLLDDVDIFPPDEELPAYEDHAPLIPGLPTPATATPPVAGPSGSASPRPSGSGLPANYSTYFELPPVPPFSTHDLFLTEYRTHFPNYSNNPKQLYSLIREQANYPPSYFVQLHGTHTETRRNGNKETKEKITDFYIRINITNLLAQAEGGAITLLPHNKRGYRGTIIPKSQPTVVSSLDEEEAATRLDELRLWCEKYCFDPSRLKSFTLSRKIINHDTERLKQLLRSALVDTHYRGHLQIDFPVQHKRVIIYSPSLLNKWRMTVWIRWVFYLTFLWVFAWPILFFLTARYKIVDAVYQYANEEPGNDISRKCSVMSEVEWFKLWEEAIKQAAVARMVNKDGCLDEEYRVAVERNRKRGRVPRQVSSTGSAFADEAFGVLRQGLDVVAGYRNRQGWGADS